MNTHSGLLELLETEAMMLDQAEHILKYRISMPHHMLP